MTPDSTAPVISQADTSAASAAFSEPALGTAPTPASLPPSASSSALDLINLLPGLLLLAVAGTGLVLVWVVWSLFFASGLAFPSGKVTLEGAPLTEARVTFTGDDGKAGPFVTKTDAAGRYTLLSNTNDGVPRGKYRVTIHKVGLKDGTLPTEPEELEKAIRARKMESLVNTMYEDFATTPLRAEVASGSNTRDFDLKQEP